MFFSPKRAIVTSETTVVMMVSQRHQPAPKKTPKPATITMKIRSGVIHSGFCSLPGLTENWLCLLSPQVIHSNVPAEYDPQQRNVDEEWEHGPAGEPDDLQRY